ncbi:hypothetical protein AVEN_28086-1 [Araneus ventricosus]|uniref:Uncharacterized protein n=1 Tax=Araneus ventricosus TaxID=182803 RepID=A0A4Y2MW54_ARAVE|nr:hypothetical protein AVEN_28086-1 [Araneus ventricosus]
MMAVRTSRCSHYITGTLEISIFNPRGHNEHVGEKLTEEVLASPGDVVRVRVELPPLQCRDVPLSAGLGCYRFDLSSRFLSRRPLFTCPCALRQAYGTSFLRITLIDHH